MTTTRTFTAPYSTITAESDGTVKLAFGGGSNTAYRWLSADDAKALGGELCHAANAAFKLEREAEEARNKITAADIKAGAVFFSTDLTTRRDAQRTVVQTAADRFVFVADNFRPVFAAIGPQTADEMVELTRINGYRKVR